MHAAEGNLWKLSYAQLARLCEEIARNPSRELDPHIKAEAERIDRGWADAFAINTHEEGAPARQASIMLALRKRTIELVVKTHPETE